MCSYLRDSALGRPRRQGLSGRGSGWRKCQAAAHRRLRPGGRTLFHHPLRVSVRLFEAASSLILSPIGVLPHDARSA